MEFKVGDKVLYGTEKYIVTDVAYYTYGLTDDRGCVTWAIKEDLKLVKPTIEDLRDYMLEHFVTEHGELNICGLDFSAFSVDINTSGMKVNGNLLQGDHKVCGHLYQGHHKVGGDLYEGNHKVELDYVCKGVEYGVELFVDKHSKIIEKITKEELAEVGYCLDV